MTETEVLEWYERAWHFVYRHGYGGALAEDLVHEMMVDMLSHPTRAHHLHFVWMHARDQVMPRVQHHGVRAPIHYVSPSTTEGGTTMDVEAWLSVDELIQRCPVKHQWWLRLVVFEDWRLKEVAALAGVTPTALSLRLRPLRPLLTREGSQHKHVCAQPRNHANR